MSEKLECCGGCEDREGHRGEVREVWVENLHYSGAYFEYCDAAVAEDIKRGFTVTAKDSLVREAK